MIKTKLYISKTLLLLALLIPLSAFSQPQKPRLVIPVGHTISIMSGAVSPDGRFIATASEDNTAKLWDFATLKEVVTYKGHKGLVGTVEFSADGNLLLTSSHDKTIRLWETKTGKELLVLNGHRKKIRNACFMSADQEVISCAKDSMIIIWNAITGKVVRQIQAPTELTHLSLNSNATTVVAGGQDGKMYMYDTKTLTLKATFEGTEGPVSHVVFSPDGRQILASSTNGNVCLWDADKNQLIKTFAGNSKAVYCAAFNPDMTQILTACADKNIYLWDVAQNKQIQTFKGHKKEAVWCAFMPEGDKIMSSSFDATLRFWDTENAKELRCLQGHSGFVYYVKPNKPGTLLLTGTSSRDVKIWDLENGSMLPSLKGHTGMILSGAFSNNGKWVATGSADKTIRVWDLTSRKCLFELKGHAESVTGLSFSPDDSLLASCSDTVIMIWKMPAGKLVKKLGGHTSWITSVEFSPDGRTLLSASWDKTVRRWDVPNGKCMMVYTGHPHWVNSASFSPDGSMVASGSNDKTVRLWDANTGKNIRTINTGNAIISSVSFSSDGKCVIAGKYDGKITKYDMNGNEVISYVGHDGFVNTVAVNGENLFSGSIDGTARLWNTNTGILHAMMTYIDSTDWFITAPSGLYDASSGAMKQLYYVVGVEPVEIGQMKDVFYEPALLSKITGFNKEGVRKIDLAGDVKMYPKVTVTVTNNETASVTIKNQGGGIGKIRVLINGKEMQGDVRGNSFNADAPEFKFIINIKDHPFLLKGVENAIEVQAYNKDCYMVSRGVRANIPLMKNDTVQVPSLFILSAGVSDYAGGEIDLRYPAKDATDIATALQLGADNLFGAKMVHSYILTTGQPDSLKLPYKKNIQAAFDEIAKKARSNDILVVYLSGHGINGGGQDGDFYFLTRDASSANPNTYSDPVIRQNNCISSTELTDMIKKVPALKQVLIIDACGSGRVVDNLVQKRDIPSNTLRALERMKDRTGMHIITGCAADAVSYEASKYGQGLLTYSLLEGLKGAALRETKFADVIQLFQYSKDRVPVLASGIGGIQEPRLFSPYGNESFDIGMFEKADKDKVPLAAEKPIFLMSNFQDDDQMADVLGLEKLVDEAFQTYTVKGTEASFVFIEVKDFPGAYVLRGRYKVKGDNVNVKVNVFKGTEIAGTYSVSGVKTDIAALATSIVEKAKALSK